MISERLNTVIRSYQFVEKFTIIKHNEQDLEVDVYSG